MKILVPTDFSQCAEHALNAAIQLAKKWEGEIHLYHSANIPDDWEDLPAGVRYQDTIHKPIALRVRNKLNTLADKIKASGIPCYNHYTGGKFLNNITEITDEINFNLIVMGSQGASSKDEWFLGSNTQKIVRKLHRNVLVIKEEVSEINFKKVLFVTGLDKEDKDAFRYFLQFISKFEVEKVHVMTVNTTSFFSQPYILVKEVLKDFKTIASDFPIETHFYRDYSIDAGIRHFSENYGIDLVAISNHTRRPLKRIFSGSNVEMLVNHSKVPVLAIDYTSVKMPDGVKKDITSEKVYR